MTRYRTDNTDGYSIEQLAELNRRFEAELFKLRDSEREEKSLLDAISEWILRTFDAGAVR